MGEQQEQPTTSNPAEATPPPPQPQQISPHLTLQAPLSRRGHGPGLVLVLDHYALIEKSEKVLDPPPLQKWAEEGFAVAQVLVPGKVEDGGEFPLERALEALKGCEGCDWGEGVGLISYLSRNPFYVQEAACRSPHIKALVSYGGKKFTLFTAPNECDSTTTAEKPTVPPQLVHLQGAEPLRRKSFSVVQNLEPADGAPSSTSHEPTEGIIKSYRYLEAKPDSGWILPADEDYHSQSAHLAHTRTLTFLKPLLNGPYFDLEAVWDEHCHFEFGERDVAKTMATMVAQPYVNHIPTMTGGIGQERLTAFYTNHFIHSNPPDTALSLVSRTVGIDRVIDEFVFSLTHTQEVPWLLPGVPPTGKKLDIPFTSVVALRGDRLCHEHISWDQATALRQAGILPEWVLFPGQIEGRDAEKGKRFEVRLPVAGVETARKLVDEGCVESNGLMEGQGWREVDDV